jgi:hypothetical protein
MMMLKSPFLTAAAMISGIPVQAAAQASYPLPQSQAQMGSDRPEGGHYPQPIYGKPAYGYSETSLRSFIGHLLDDRYSEIDRTAVRQCASAAMQMAAVQYQPQISGNAHPYGHGYNVAALMRLTSITDLRRRENGLRVSGVINSRFGHPPYGHAGGYENNGYAAAGDLTFRCNVDYSGIVYDLRVQRSNSYRG